METQQQPVHLQEDERTLVIILSSSFDVPGYVVNLCALLKADDRFNVQVLRLPNRHRLKNRLPVVILRAYLKLEASLFRLASTAPNYSSIGTDMQTISLSKTKRVEPRSPFQSDELRQLLREHDRSIVVCPSNMKESIAADRQFSRATVVVGVACKGVVSGLVTESAATFHRQATSPYAVTTLDEHGDVRARVIGSIANDTWVSANLHTLHLKYAKVAYSQVRCIVDESWGEAASDSEPIENSAALPRFTTFVRYLTHGVLPRIWRKYAVRKQVSWQVHISSLEGGVLEKLVLKPCLTLKNPERRFFADPFLASHQQELYCFFEDYNFSEGRACISVARISDHQAQFLGRVLEEPHHLSFPNVFLVDDQWFMLPEGSRSGEIRLYHAVNFPFDWKLHQVLMKNVSAADSTLTFHDGKWWLATNLDSANDRAHSSELHLFFSDSFDSSEWTPHPGNPVVKDALSARNAGPIFYYGGKLIRPVQRQGFGFYGKAVGLFEITELSTSAYSERLLSDLEVCATKFEVPIYGLHHFHFLNGLVAFDTGSYVRNRGKYQLTDEGS